MYSEVVEIAAWIIVGRAAWVWFTDDRKHRASLLEREAVRAEFSRYRDDDQLSDDMNKERYLRHSERQADLKLRYPQHLIDEPEGKYFQAAADAQKKISLLEQWGPGVGGILLWLLGRLIYNFVTGQ
jgi:hypothetical protein